MRNILATLLAILIYHLLSAQEQKQFPPITLVNSIEYNDTAFLDNQPGCGFLLNIGDETLAVTCKHALWENKPNNLFTVDINSNIKQWKMFVKNDPNQYIVLDRLINNNPDEKISELNINKDYLVFTIKENRSNVIPLKLAEYCTKKDEEVYKVGWSFFDKEGPQRIYKSSFYKNYGPRMLVTDHKQINQAGTSGSPVVNKDEELIGIVSSWYFDRNSQKWYASPCNTEYLKEVIIHYWLNKTNNKLNISSIKKFLDYYKSNTNKDFLLSNNLITNILFNKWLTKNNLSYNIENHTIFSQEINDALELNLPKDEYTINQIKIKTWENNFIKNKASINALSEINYDYLDLIRIINRLINIDQNKALAIAQFAIEKFPNTGQLYSNLADVYFAKGDVENAKLNYEKCLKFYPGYPYAKDKLRQL